MRALSATEHYAMRNQILRSMGFADYAAYLGSPLWRSIRGRAFAVSKRCYGCNGKADQIHHRSYAPAVMEGHDIRPLVPVCAACHEAVEFLPGGAKSSPTEANEMLDIIRSVGLAALE